MLYSLLALNQIKIMHDYENYAFRSILKIKSHMVLFLVQRKRSSGFK